jgi:deoxyribose-phosphate aldolase
MHIDYQIADIDITDAEVKELVKEIIALNKISTITVPYYLIKVVRSVVDSKDIPLSCTIDYPLGISDSKTRLTAIEQAAKIGANLVDIVMPQNLASNRKYDKIREDLKLTTELCKNNNIEPRYLLEYRVFDHHCLKKICEILDDFNIKQIFPSTGYFIDNLTDNIIAASFLHQNSKNLEIYCSGNIWSEKHFELLNKASVFGIRISSIHILKKFLSHNFK